MRSLGWNGTPHQPAREHRYEPPEAAPLDGAGADALRDLAGGRVPSLRMALISKVFSQFPQRSRPPANRGKLSMRVIAASLLVAGGLFLCWGALSCHPEPTGISASPSYAFIDGSQQGEPGWVTFSLAHRDRRQIRILDV